MNLKRKKGDSKSKPHKKTNAIVCDSVGSYEKHPFFIKKTVAGKALLLKVGLPKQITKKVQA